MNRVKGTTAVDQTPSQKRRNGGQSYMKSDALGQGLVNGANVVKLTDPTIPASGPRAIHLPNPRPSMPHLVLLTTSLFTVVEDIVTGVIFW